MNNQKKELVKRHNATITIKASLTLVQRKLLSALLFNAYPNLLNHRIHDISYSSLCKLMGYNSNNSDELRKNIEGLLGTAIEWDYQGEDGKPAWKMSTLLASGGLENGIVSYEYSSVLAEKLYNPEIYTRINLEIIRALSSTYSVAIYEHCLRYANVGSTGWMSLEFFRDIIGVSGLKNYKEFRRLKSKIVNPSVEEINATTNINIVTSYRKKGRSYSDIKFSIKFKHEEKQPPLPLEDGEFDSEDLKKTSIDSETIRNLIDYGISYERAINFVAEYGEKYILEKIELVQKQKVRKNIKRSVGGLLIKAIEDNYQDAEIIEEKKRKEAVEKKRKLDEIRTSIEHRQSKIRSVERAYSQKCRETIQAYCDGLPNVAKEAIVAEFTSELSDTTKGDFRKRGWSCPLVSTRQIVMYWSDKIPLPSYESIAIENGVKDWVKINQSLDDLKATLESLEKV